MAAEARPQCPDCTYLLTGLSVPRCPECGLQFDVRLLTDPALARPRPAWERRRHVSFMAAVWRTVIDVTFRPSAFFAGIQQPDRLRRPIYWVLLAIGGTYLFVLAWYGGMVHAGLSGLASLRMPWVQQYGVAALGTALALVWGLTLILLPLVLMLLLADLLCWCDRPRYRLFFKRTMYSMTVYIWLAVAICAVGTGLKLNQWAAGTPPNIPDKITGWTNCLLAAATTWQFALVYRATLDPHFAGLLPAHPRRRAVLALLVPGLWLAAMYLTLFDCHIGLRFATAAWDWGLRL